MVVNSIIKYNQFSSVYKQLDLSPGEIKVLRHSCSEKTNKEIAELLCLSVAEVESHKKNINAKASIHNDLINAA